MAGLTELERISVNAFGGEWTRLEAGDVPTSKALLSQNCEFQPGAVGTRKGFAPVFNPAEPMTSLFNWVFDAHNYLVWYCPASGNMRLVPDLSNPVAVDLYTQAGAAGASIASGGTRLFVATFDAAGKGIGQCRVVGQYGASIFTDKAFLHPLTLKPTLAATGTGSCTAGVKRVGYIVQTRNGFVGKISPVLSGGTFDTSSTVTSAGNDTITFNMTTTWPAEASLVWPVMTASANLDRYYIVPNVAAAGVPGSLSWPISFTIDISDEDLASTGTDVTDHLSLLTQAADGSGPFTPSAVLEYGFRTVYLADDTAYVSEPDAAQKLTADQHVLTLPGFRKLVTGFVLGKVMYLCGPNWTFAFEDTGDVPVTWPTPRSVDGSIGTLAPRGVTVNASQGFAWVAHQTGLWLFSGGTYQTKPISYYNDTWWKRINWSAAETVQVIDNKDKQQVYVLAPLSGATSPTNILMWDYSDGVGPEEVKFSLWYLIGYNPGAGCVVMNDSNKHVELWLGSSAVGKVLRQKDAQDSLPYNDDGVAIDWQFETALLPGLGEDLGAVFHHYADQIRVQGSGSLLMAIRGLDRTKIAIPTPTALSLTPGSAYTKLYARLRSNSASVLLALNGVDHWCLFSAIDHYYARGPYRSEM